MRIRPSGEPNASATGFPSLSAELPSFSSTGKGGKGGITLSVPPHLSSDLDLIARTASDLGLDDIHVLRTLDMITGKASAETLCAIQRELPAIAISRSGEMRAYQG